MVLLLLFYYMAIDFIKKNKRIYLANTRKAEIKSKLELYFIKILTFNPITDY
jgi:hypothetical protein